MQGRGRSNEVSSTGRNFRYSVNFLFFSLGGVLFDMGECTGLRNFEYIQFSMVFSW